MGVIASLVVMGIPVETASLYETPRWNAKQDENPACFAKTGLCVVLLLLLVTFSPDVQCGMDQNDCHDNQPKGPQEVENTIDRGMRQCIDTAVNPIAMRVISPTPCTALDCPTIISFTASLATIELMIRQIRRYIARKTDLTIYQI